jgi:hypothetical protein
MNQLTITLIDRISLIPVTKRYKNFLPLSISIWRIKQSVFDSEEHFCLSLSLCEQAGILKNWNTEAHLQRLN